MIDVRIVSILLTLIGWSLALQHCPNECNWSGRCDVHRGHCSCYQGYYNADCSGDCGCAGHGVCKTDHTCDCDDGWTWSTSLHKCVWECNCPHGVRCMGPGICACAQSCKYGTCWNGQCECWTGYTGHTCSHYNPLTMPNRGVSVGMNLGGLSYYSSEVKFVDVAKESMEWITQRREGAQAHQWNTQEEATVAYDDDGYPKRLEDTMILVTLMLRGGHWSPGGNYTILYDGEGELDLGLVHVTRVYEGKGRIIVNMDPGSGGIELKLMRINPQNHIRNIRVILPGFEDRHAHFPYNPLFLETITRYSEFRYMDFMHTNAHRPEPTTWASRRKQTFYTQTGSYGAAIENMILLSNMMGANPWFNIPHAADDDFIRQFAALVKSSLRPDLKVYLEYSNEVWNGIFRQTAYTVEKGTQLGLDSHGNRAGMKYYNQRSSEVMQIFQAVFGNHGNDRLIPVWAWQTGYQDYYRQALDDLGNRTRDFKALSITGYFSCDGAASKHKAELPNMTMSEISDLCALGLSTQENLYQHYMDVAKNHSLALVMYEGGPAVMEPGAISHGTSNDAVTTKAIAFNSDPHIKVNVMAILNAWKRIVTDAPGNQASGGLFNYFSSAGFPSKYGSWGMLQYTGEDLHSVPKYMAVHEFITKQLGHDVLGNKCSFVKSGNLAFGCFKPKNGHSWKCGKSYNHGSAWEYLPDLPGQGILSILDGYDSITHTLFVRTVDAVGVNQYHVTNTNHFNWTTTDSWDYHSKSASRHVTRSLAAGDYHHLATAHADCVYYAHAPAPVLG
ncbi:uncharacterized protein LOC110457373 [Mizuhopecten yessoensis]|uniref:Tenascin-X n=1 Tax=Mizuhopecten yessoensis TaxID=6573 RepID=A0A210Q8V5_MIZYE|nr:uncharacterized protein LOC110457373 [Mizuhopecten yessoensis]OWF45168.1 Tenascin-X [Mizuhopecten yessoensis]